MKSFFLLFLLLPSFLISQNSDWAYRNPYPQTDFYAIKFFDQNTGYLIGAGGTFLKTTTGGNDWINMPYLTNIDLYAMYFFDVNTGYIVGAGGHIFYTSSGGITWTSIVTNNAYPLRSVTFTNQNTGYISGDNGELYKTTTGITGWQRINLNSNLKFNRVYFLNENKGFVCADSGKIFITTNAGNNWLAQNVGVNYQNVKGIEFTDSFKGYIGMTALSAGSNTNLYKTTDGGLTWQNVSLTIAIVSFTDIKFINNSTGFVCSDNGPVLVTTNSGGLWRVFGVPPSTVMKGISKLDTSVIICGTNGWIAKAGPSGNIDVIGGSKKNFISMGFVNENTGICIGDYQVISTSNGGAKWNIQMKGNYSWFEGYVYLVKSLAFPSGNLFIVYHSYTPTYFPQESIHRSTDGGITWNYYYGSLGLFGGMDEKEGVTYVTHTSTVLKSTGGSFTQLYSVTGSMLGDVSFFNANTGFVISNNNSGNNGLLKTTNGGMNWQFVINQGNRYLLHIDLLPSGTGYAAADDSGYMIKTTDFGTSWQILTTGLNQYTADMKFIDDNNGWLLNYFYDPIAKYRLYFTKNGGLNFYPITSLGNFNVKSFSFLNPDVGYVCGDSGVVLKTTNGGLTFINQNGEVDLDKFSLSQNYPNPFNPVTNIKFNIPLSGLVPGGRGVFTKLIVYDMLGKEIAILINQQMQPGSYNVDWDASAYPSGVYFYKIIVGDPSTSSGRSFVESRKMVLIK